MPSDIPSNPNREYKDEWSGWGDWLGTGRVADQNRKYRSYQEASAWAKSQGIKKLEEWRSKTKDKNFPKDIPVVPYNTYKNEWTNWGDFLQTGYLHYKDRKRATYLEAKAWAKQMGVLRKTDWDQLSIDGRMPQEIPANIWNYYKEWTNWADFLDNQTKGGASITEVVISNEVSQFVEVDNSIRSIRLNDGKVKRIDIAIPSLKLLIEYDGAHWHRGLLEKDKLDNEKLKTAGWTVLRVRERPLKTISNIDILVNPKDSLFKKTSAVINQLIAFNMLRLSPRISEYLNRGILSEASSSLKDKNWLSYEDAKDWVKQKGIKSETQWRKFKTSNALPSNIPATPEEAYRTNWLGWGDFLGTDRRAPVKNMKTFSEARDFVRGLKLKDSRAWRTYIKKEDCPEDIPSNPDKFYEEWISWMNWLGTEETAKRKRNWLPFDQAVEISRSLGLKSETEWRQARKAGRIPNELPSAPEQLYRSEWQGWGYWLGTGNKKRES